MGERGNEPNGDAFRNCRFTFDSNYILFFKGGCDLGKLDIHSGKEVMVISGFFGLGKFVIPLSVAGDKKAKKFVGLSEKHDKHYICYHDTEDLKE